MSLEDRLNAIGIDNSTSKVPAQGVPKADNLLVLLVQGLQSSDSKILNVRIFEIFCIFIQTKVLSFSCLYFFLACIAT